MNIKINFHILLAICFIFTASMGVAKEFIIYSISQSLPMGEQNEVIKKNYYLNIGSGQGLKPGNDLDVFRDISILDPYTSKKRYNYQVKIGELKIIHVEEGASIAKMKKVNMTDDDPLFEIENFMIGDKVDIQVQ